MSEPTKYGFYSARAEAFGGSVFWLTPSGAKVVVTCVSLERQASEYVWPDKVFVGEVTQFAGIAEEGSRRRSSDLLGGCRG